MADAITTVSRSTAVPPPTLSESTPAVANYSPEFDHADSLARLGGDVQLFSKLVEFFYEDAPDLVKDIREGVAAGDAYRVERAAHSIKGLASNFSAHATVHAAFTVEELAREHKLGEVLPALATLEQHLARLRQALAPFAPR